MLPEMFQSTPAGMAMGSQLWLAGLVFLTTFVLEDAAVVSGGLLVAAGWLNWPLALAACFIGIWAGDVGLYGVARVAGRSFFERTILRRYAAGLERSERWFAERGTLILITSRVIPGARLPTYLAAGFLRLPFNQFVGVTGAAALVWTAGGLLLTQMIGARLLVLLRAYHQGAAVLLLALPLLFLALVLFKKCLRPKL